MISLLVRTVVFAVLVPATVIVYVPWLILGASHDMFVLEWWRLLGLVPLLAGLAVLFWCFAGFIIEGRGTPAPYDPPRRLVTGALGANARRGPALRLAARRVRR